MAPRFTLLVEARRPIAPATLPPGRALGCGGCPEVLTGLYWTHPDDMVDPYNAPAWCTACALRFGRLAILRTEGASDDDQSWEPDPPPAPDLVTVTLPGGFSFRLEQRG